MADFKDFIAGRASVIPLTGSEQVPIISGGVTKRTSAQAIANLVPAVEGPAGPAGADGATGATGPAGADGAPGPAGPAPAGTGFVKVTGGVLDTPSATIPATAITGPFAFGTANTVAASSIAGTGASAQGAQSFAVGYGVSASGLTTMAAGYHTQNAITASFAVGGGPYNNQAAQAGIIPLNAMTADATPTSTRLANDRYLAPIPAYCAWCFRVLCVAQSSAYKTSAWSIEGAISRNNANVVRIVGTPTVALIAQDAEMAGCAVAVSALGSPDYAINIAVTGLAATNIRWTCSVFYSQARYG